MVHTPIRVALIGAGNISRRYVEGMSRYDSLDLVACTDAIPAAAHALAAEVGIVAYEAVQELLQAPGIDVVVNITPPTVHAEVTIAALEAGKHVYVEKPLAASVADAKQMLAATERTGRTLGGAPDTFLGSAAQTARKAIDDGVIGDPIAATAFSTHSKAERWHPNPTFLFQPGGGPLLDLGPYYITTLVSLLGPVARVSGTTRIGAATRTVTSPDRTVDTIEVNTTTHASATLNFANGVVGTLVASFDIWDSHLPKIEIYGTAGTLTVPDPNQYDGPVLLRRTDEDNWTELSPVFEPSGAPDTPTQLLRGPGVADLAAALYGEPHRATAQLAFHVLEILQAIETSSSVQASVAITSPADRPQPLTTDASADASIGASK